ncbi:MAG TPA: type II secretion system F family protein [Parachlamydiaceae bacterium]|nr:type II secretion system F family protein [Parachlamydiaceae bacterium]
MPIYQYAAFNTQGKKLKGHIEAHSEKEAKEILREQGQMVTKLGLKENVSSKQQLTGDNLIAFTVQLSQLVGAGVPLYESLVAIEEQCRQESYHHIILRLSEQIKAGNSLSNAMGDYPKSFDRLYRAMILAGESSGAQDIILEKLSQLLKKQSKLKKQITTALIYPGILASFSLLIILLLLGFVVPSIEAMFEDRKLNGFTEFVMSASHFFRDYWWLYLPCLAAFFAFIFLKLKSPAGKLFLEKKMIKLPILKTLITQTALARFCRTMATLNQGGLSMIDSLQIARAVMRNIILEEEVKKAEAKIIEGSSLSIELSKSPLIPLLVSRMLAVGEESGTTVAMMNKIADLYEEEIEKTLDRLMALAQPAILIVMGTIIGIVLLAIMLPLTDVSSFSPS